MKHEGFTLWLTGMSGAGKSTLSEHLMTRFREGGARAELLDGDEVRAALSPNLASAMQTATRTFADLASSASCLRAMALFRWLRQYRPTAKQGTR